MYIENKYWNNYIGDTDDSLNLIAFLEDQSSDEIEFSDILQALGLNTHDGNFRRTTSPLGFTNSMGIYLDFTFAIDILTDLAAILLECKVNSSVDLHDLEPYDTDSRKINIIATPDDYELLNKSRSRGGYARYGGNLWKSKAGAVKLEFLLLQVKYINCSYY